MKKVYLMMVAVFLVAAVVAQPTVEIKKGWDVEMSAWDDDDIWSEIDRVAIETEFNGESPTLSADFRAFYTDESIYIYLWVEDDEHLPAWVAGVAEHWTHDKPEVYFDVNDVLVDGVGAMTAASGHFQFAPPFTEEGYGTPAIATGTMSDIVEWVYDRDGENYGVMYKFPIEALINVDGVAHDLSSLMALPENVGFDFTIIDRDTGDDAHKRMVWANDATGGGESWSNMDDIGRMILLDEEIETSSSKMLKVAELGVYPNPVQNQLTINGSFNRVVVSNIVGQQVKVVETSRSLNVSDLAKGIYVVKAYDNDQLIGSARITKN